MTKQHVSTFDREMQNLAFKEEFEKGYHAFVLSEILIDLMKESRKSVRGLANEVGVSQTLIITEILVSCFLAFNYIIFLFGL